MHCILIWIQYCDKSRFMIYQYFLTSLLENALSMTILRFNKLLQNLLSSKMCLIKPTYLEVVVLLTHYFLIDTQLLSWPQHTHLRPDISDTEIQVMMFTKFYLKYWTQLMKKKNNKKKRYHILSRVYVEQAYIINPPPPCLCVAFILCLLQTLNS